MFTIEFYVAEDRPEAVAGGFLAALARELGVSADAPGQRQVEWQEAATGARALVELGERIAGDEPVLPARDPEGWRRVPAGIGLSLDGPHWRVVEFSAWLGRLLEKWPEIAVLWPREPGAEEDEDEPTPFDRHRLLAAWEPQHFAFEAGRGDSVQVDRKRSLALWRALREVGTGRKRFPELYWPTPSLLLHDGQALLVVIAPLAGPDLALPLVDMVVVARPGDPGLLPVDELLTAAGGAGGAEELGVAGARRIPRYPAVDSLLCESRLVDPGSYRLLEEGDWYD